MKEEWSQDLAYALPVIYTTNLDGDDDPSRTGVIIIQTQLAIE